MPFIPHTEQETTEMLEAIGISSIDELFSEIPPELHSGQLTNVPSGISEMEIGRIMSARSRQDGTYINFIGGGVYEHHIPAAVWELTTRGEFYTAYTPYQAEASQGSLQVVYEFQTMMTSLMDMDVSNASLYEGASALAEAILAAVRSRKNARTVLLPRTVNPVYRKVAATIVKNQDVELIELPFSVDTGCTDIDALKGYQGDGVAAVVVPQPNYFGVLEDVDALTDCAHELGGLAVAVVNPTTVAVLKPPGRWGEMGADIAVGEGQPLGIPLSSGGPYMGFMCCKQKYVRQIPGRIVGRTEDDQGNSGFTLTLQAREQHIRRSKATSNICTNQGLCVVAATLYMSLLGPEGLRRVAVRCHRHTSTLEQKLCAIEGVQRCFSAPFFNEVVVQLDQPAADVLRAVEAQGIIGGIDLSADYPELGNALLTCATETRTVDEIEGYATHLERILSRRSPDPASAEKAAE